MLSFFPSIHFLSIIQFRVGLQPFSRVIGWGAHQETFNPTSLLKGHVSFNSNLLRSCRKSDINKRVTCKLETVPVVSFSSCSATINKPPHEHLESFLPAAHSVSPESVRPSHLLSAFLSCVSAAARVLLHVFSLSPSFGPLQLKKTKAFVLEVWK